jgi:hypothetical protein
VRGARLLLAAVALAAAAPAGAQAPGYRSATTRILAEGRAASTLIANGSGGRLYAKFAPQFRAQVSLPQLLQIIGATLSQAPVGAVRGESALPLAPDEGIYQGDYGWGTKTLAITLVFDARGRIAGVSSRSESRSRPIRTPAIASTRACGCRSTARGGSSGAARPSSRTTT